MKKKEDKERGEALSELRKEHWKAVFMDNMKVWKEIRDRLEIAKCPHCKKEINWPTAGSDKNKIEAAKCLSRQLDIISPERTGQTVTKTSGRSSWLEEALSPDDLAEVLNVINPPAKPS